jgi:transketolase
MPHIRPIPHITDRNLCKIEGKAFDIRESIMTMLEEARSGHSAGPLDLSDIFAALYFHVLNHDPKKPDWEERDRLLMSCGHNVPVRYAAMAHSGYFPVEELMTLRKLGSRLQGHPEITFMPGLENTSGPLGDGSPQSAGMAYAGKMNEKSWHVYCILSDGELDAGITWEAAMFAAKYRLDNLTWIVDRNNIQIDGNTEDIMPLEPLHEKFASFGFEVIEIDGHNIQEIVDACRLAKSVAEKPAVIIAHTIPGRGVDFMEDDFRWHGAPPGKGPEDKVEHKKQLKAALKSLRTLEGKIRSECE